jgi:hypothetical protein
MGSPGERSNTASNEIDVLKKFLSAGIAENVRSENGQARLGCPTLFYFLERLSV